MTTAVRTLKSVHQMGLGDDLGVSIGFEFSGDGVSTITNGLTVGLKSTPHEVADQLEAFANVLRLRHPLPTKTEEVG